MKSKDWHENGRESVKNSRYSVRWLLGLVVLRLLLKYAKGELLIMENKGKKVWVKPQMTVKSISEKPEYRKAYEEVNGKK